MKSARRILLSKFSKTNHSRRIYYSSVPETLEIKVIDSVGDLDFPEYDPTPYGGGYDLATSYGQPLPPSEAICYPPSPHDPNSSTLKGFSYGSLPSPYGKEGADHGPPKTSREVADPSAGVEKQPSHAEDGNSAANGGRDVDFFSHGSPDQGEEEGYALGNSTRETQAADNCCSSSGEYRRDSFFSWLFSFEEDEHRYSPRYGDEWWNGGQLKGAAEYLFGFSYPGIENKDEIYGYRNPIYCYEKKHGYEQSIYGQGDYSKPSWLQRATYYQDYQEKERNWSNNSADIVPTYFEDYQEEEYSQSKYASNNGVPIYNKNYQEKMSTDMVPTYYEDYQEEEYPHSKHVSADSVPIFIEDCQEKEEYTGSKGSGTEIVPIFYEDYQEEEHYTQAKDVTTDIVLTYYEDYQEEEYPQSKYVSSSSVPLYNEDYQAEYSQFKGTGAEIVPIYYEDYQEEEDYTQSKDVTTDIVPTYYEDYQEEEYV